MFDFHVQPDEGDAYDVKATARDFVVWEKVSKGEKTWAGLMSDLNMTDLYHLAHVASRRQGLFTGTLREFETGVELRFEQSDEEESDPTPPGASPDDS